jgi:RNA polymerase sigma-70 factor (ECF subfamily)
VHAREDEVDEPSLMAAYVSGDHGAFERLFRRLAPKVYGFFMRSFGDATVAEELVQVTFLHVHRSRATYRLGLPVRPWLFAVAAHARRDELRRRYRIKEDCDEEALVAAEAAHAAATAAGSVADDAEDARATRVREAIASLPESQRVVVHLHRYEGLTFVEIAAILGTTPVAVRVRAFRAYERLREELADLVRAGRGHDAA